MGRSDRKIDMNMYKNDLRIYGTYNMGLTAREIKKYLVDRAKDKGINHRGIVKKFNEVAGCNTMAVEFCEMCRKSVTLTYRWDVIRFADVLFEGKATYWD